MSTCVTEMYLSETVVHINCLHLHQCRTQNEIKTAHRNRARQPTNNWNDTCFSSYTNKSGLILMWMMPLPISFGFGFKCMFCAFFPFLVHSEEIGKCLFQTALFALFLFSQQAHVSVCKETFSNRDYCAGVPQFKFFWRMCDHKLHSRRHGTGSHWCHSLMRGHDWHRGIAFIVVFFFIQETSTNLAKRSFFSSMHIVL